MMSIREILSETELLKKPQRNVLSLLPLIETISMNGHIWDWNKCNSIILSEYSTISETLHAEA